MIHRRYTSSLFCTAVLAVGVGVYAAPREFGTARGKSDVGRLVTGASQELRAAIDGGIAGAGSYVGITGIDPTNGSSYGANYLCAGAGGVLRRHRR